MITSENIPLATATNSRSRVTSAVINSLCTVLIKSGINEEKMLGPRIVAETTCNQNFGCNQDIFSSAILAFSVMCLKIGSQNTQLGTRVLQYNIVQKNPRKFQRAKCTPRAHFMEGPLFWLVIGLILSNLYLYSEFLRNTNFIFFSFIICAGILQSK